MASFQIGEEVLYQGDRYILAGIASSGLSRYRLLACTPEGTRVVWASEQQLKPVERYRTPLDDTAKV